MSEKLIESHHGKTFYRKSGEGNETILFIHGATADHLLFKHQFEFFEKHYKIIALDVPAHGRSKPYNEFSLSRACEEIFSILEKENIKQVHLAGQSMGGYIAQIFYLKYPDRVKSIVTIGSSPVDPAYYSGYDNFMLRITPGILRFYPYRTLIKQISNQVSFTKEGKSYMMETLERYTKKEIADIMEAVYLGLQEVNDNTKIQVPLLITYGEKDSAGKVQTYCKRWSKSDDLPLIVIPEAAHNANFDNPGFFNHIYQEFLVSI